MTIKLGLVGEEILHSKMPRLQEYLGQLSGIDIKYDLLDSSQIDNFDPIKEIQASIINGYSGLNVTHPFKQHVVTIVNEPYISGHERIGSYNTLKFMGNKIVAANTDFSGFKRGFLCRFNDVEVGSVFLCGAGGVGCAVANALIDLGCHTLKIYDVSTSQAMSLAETLSDRQCQVEVLAPDEISAALLNVDGIMNCTSLGMYKNPGTAIDLTLLGQQKWVFDAVYTPLDTVFLKAARAAGLRCLSGFDLWLFQGIDAFKIFTDIEIVPDEIIISEALSWVNGTA